MILQNTVALLFTIAMMTMVFYLTIGIAFFIFRYLTRIYRIMNKMVHETEDEVYIASMFWPLYLKK